MKLPSFQISNINRNNVIKAIARTIFLLFDDKITKLKKEEWTTEDEINLNKLIHEHLLWKLSENLSKSKGKYIGNIYWSVSAIKSYNKYSGVNNKLGIPDALSHEHIVPRKRLTDYLISKYEKRVTEKEIYDDLNNKGFAVIVTNSEHYSLSDKYLDFKDVWKRYYKSNPNIKIFYNEFIPKSIIKKLKENNMLVKSIEELQDIREEKIISKKINKKISNKKYNRDQKIKLLIKNNPKKLGSKSYERFKNYYDGISVGEFLDKGGLSIDLKWDSDHNFIKLK
jgi:hypothetical protein